MKKTTFRGILRMETAGKVMRRGICDKVQMRIVDYLAALTLMHDSLGIVEVNSNCYTQSEIFFTPENWIEINHFFVLVYCTDGMAVIDVPMKEYAYHDDQWWYWSDNKTPQLYFCESRNDIANCWNLSKEEATRVTNELKSWDKECCFIVEITKEELWTLIMTKGGSK